MRAAQRTMLLVWQPDRKVIRLRFSALQLASQCRQGHGQLETTTNRSAGDLVPRRKDGAAVPT